MISVLPVRTRLSVMAVLLPMPLLTLIARATGRRARF
jgi:hypothetical protein